MADKGMAIQAGSTAAEPSIEHAFRHAFGALAAQPLTALGIAFVLSAAPSAAIQYEFYRIIGGDYGQLGRGAAIVVFAVAALLTLAVSSLAQGALVHLAARHRSGRRAGFAEALELASRATLPMMGRTVLADVATAMAAIAFLVPSILLYIVWTVSAPALVLERLGPTDSLERSQALTRGARWRVFAFQLQILVAGWVLSLAVNAMLGGRAAQFASLGGFCAGAGVATFVTAYSALARTMLYFELRDWREGPPADRLAEIFG